MPRTPMQWNAEENAALQRVRRGIRLIRTIKEINAEDETAREDSVFSHYQKLIQLRKKHEIMVYGEYHLLLPEDEDLYIYTRTLGKEQWLILCNFHEKSGKLPVHK